MNHKRVGKRRMLLAGLLSLMLLCVAACNGQPEADTNPASAPQSEQQGGESLKIGAMISLTDTMDPANAMSHGMLVAIYHVYDSLAYQTIDGVTLSLASSIEPNTAADEWTVTLREGVTFSDGTPVAGQDVLASIAHLADSPHFSMLFNNVNFEQSTATENAVVFKTNQPQSDFLSSALGMISPVAPEGKFEGVGAGPYLYEKGDASTGIVLTANEDYWAGRPKISKLEIMPISDSAAQINALKAGEIDYAFGLNTSAVKMVENDEHIETPTPKMDSANALMIVFNSRVAPFDDPQLRLAAKKVVDREKMVNVLLAGYGEVGNDLIGMGFEGYPQDISQRQANKEEAKAVFAEKGVTEFDLKASDIIPGQVAAAEFIVQEFAEIGVKVHVETVDPQNFFAQMEDIFATPSFTFYNINRAPMTAIRSAYLESSSFNPSGYTSEEVERLFEAASASTDPDEQAEYVLHIYEELHEKDGNFIWGYQEQISAHRKGLNNVETFQTMPLFAKADYKPV